MTFIPRDYAPGIHHVWVNATGNERYYLDDIDRMEWVRQFVITCAVYEWKPLAFCQLTTHVHLLIDVSDRSLPIGMRRLNLEYSRRFNDRHRRPGQFVRRRYSNRRVAGTADLLETYAYVVLNAEAAGGCERTEDWRWCSYATTIGLTRDFEFVDASIVVAELGSIDRLRSFVDARRDRLSEMATSVI